MKALAVGLKGLLLLGTFLVAVVIGTIISAIIYPI